MFKAHPWCRGPTSFFCLWLSSCPVPLAEETILSPLTSLSSLVGNQLAVEAWVYLRTLNSIPTLVYTSVLMLAPHWFNYCSFVVGFKIGEFDSSNLDFPFPYCFGYLGPLTVSSIWTWGSAFPLLLKKSLDFWQELHWIYIVLEFSVYKFLISLVKFIPGYFVLLNSSINEIFLFVSSLLV